MGRQAWPIVADVREYENIKRFVAEAAEAAGRIDILVNNASIQPFDEQSEEMAQHIDVKLMSYIRCCREVLPHMKAQGGGRIVNVTGMTARIVAALRPTNGVVNAGATNFTKPLATHLARQHHRQLHPSRDDCDRPDARQF